MVDERASRRPEFVAGTSLRLADGQIWSFPERRPGPDDPEYDGLLRAVFEAEDEAEGLRAELALTILLLSRNYDLGPDEFQELLAYPPGDPALAVLQRSVHQMILGHAESLGPRSVPRADGEVGTWGRSETGTPRPRFRSVWSLWLN